MIHHLAMNIMKNLSLFPSKGGASAQHTPHMILSQRNSDYNKHLHVEFGAYVQASQGNDPKNTIHLRTLDGIYLCPAPNLQGVYQIMDLRTGQSIKIPKEVDIPITDVVINSVEK